MSNLGGVGPDTNASEQWLYYEGIGTLYGGQLDLLYLLWRRGPSSYCDLLHLLYLLWSTSYTYCGPLQQASSQAHRLVNRARREAMLVVLVPVDTEHLGCIELQPGMHRVAAWDA